jgi:plasmid stability protein
MSGTLTIRNLDPRVKQRLRLRAAVHQRSMEAEARAILALAVEAAPGVDVPVLPPRTPEEMRERLQAVGGLWKVRGTTDDLMQATRGEG